MCSSTASGSSSPDPSTPQRASRRTSRSATCPASSSSSTPTTAPARPADPPRQHRRLHAPTAQARPYRVRRPRCRPRPHRLRRPQPGADRQRPAHRPGRQPLRHRRARLRPWEHRHRHPARAAVDDPGPVLPLHPQQALARPGRAAAARAARRRRVVGRLRRLRPQARTLLPRPLHHRPSASARRPRGQPGPGRAGARQRWGDRPLRGRPGDRAGCRDRTDDLRFTRALRYRCAKPARLSQRVRAPRDDSGPLPGRGGGRWWRSGLRREEPRRAWGRAAGLCRPVRASSSPVVRGAQTPAGQVMVWPGTMRFGLDPITPLLCA